MHRVSCFTVGASVFSVGGYNIEGVFWPPVDGGAVHGPYFPCPPPFVTLCSVAFYMFCCAWTGFVMEQVSKRLLVVVVGGTLQ